MIIFHPAPPDVVSAEFALRIVGFQPAPKPEPKPSLPKQERPKRG